MKRLSVLCAALVAGAISSSVIAGSASPAAVVLADNQSIVPGTDLFGSGLSDPQAALGDDVAFSVSLGDASAWVIVQSDGTRRTLRSDTELPGHPGFYPAVVQLHAHGVVSILADGAPGSSDPLGWLVGPVDALRLVVAPDLPVPGMPEGWTWRFPDATTVHVRPDGSAVVLNRTNGPGGVIGKAVVESPPAGAAFLVARTGAPLSTPSGPSEALAGITDIGVSDDGVALVGSLESAPSRAVVFALQDWTASLVFETGGPIPEFDNAVGGAVTLQNMSRDGRVLIGIEIQGSSPRQVGLLALEPGGQRRLISKPVHPFGDNAGQLRPSSGLINSQGVAVFRAALSDAQGPQGEVLMRRDADGDLELLAGAGSVLDTPQGQVVVSEFYGAVQFNDRGQVLVIGSDGGSGRVLGFDAHRGWAVFAGEGQNVTTTGGQSICCTQVAADFSNEVCALSPSGRVISTAFNMQGGLRVYVLSSVIPSPGLADANADSICDGRDLSVLLSNFGSPVSPPGSSADFNADGIVNGADLSILLSAFGT